MKFFICVLGMVMIIEGLPYFAFPEKMKRWMLQIQEMSDDADVSPLRLTITTSLWPLVRRNPATTLFATA